MATECISCQARSWYIRMPYDIEEAALVDATGHLVPVRREDEVWACPSCGVLIHRTYEPATMFHDYDGYTFERLPDPPLSPEALADYKARAKASKT